jgi:hypothetical protein
LLPDEKAPSGLSEQVAGSTTILRRDALLLQSSQHHVDAAHVARPLTRLDDHDGRRDHHLPKPRQSCLCHPSLTALTTFSPTLA